ncbi:MAG: efflux RND transporter periplasmic adaptor subunit [Gemmatimonadota bacterium]|nr:MAG: efflux RND transporter periplasmic adaptor subunit [Gemmatimonadota bacterium]
MVRPVTMDEPAHDLSRLRIDRDRPPPGVGRALRWSIIIVAGSAALVVVFLLLLRGAARPTVEVALAELRGGGAGASTGVTANGYVVARTQASVSSKITGRLVYLGVEEGSVVEAGEVIGRLESADYEAVLAQRQAELLTARAGLAEAEAERDQLRRDVIRTRDLQERGLASDQETEQAEAQLSTAEARVNRYRAQVRAAEAGVGVAQANLENTYIRAPFSGTVLRKDAEVGEVVAPAVTGGGLTRGAVVTMADLETLEVEVDVNEAYIARVRNGQPATIDLDAYPDTSFRGRVRQIVPTADRQRATVEVKVSILDTDPRILPEMGATVEFLEESGAAAAGPARVFVPAAAVRDEAGRQVVWVARDDRIERREVEAGPVTGDRREIRRGVNAGERVVVAGHEGLEDGTRVRIAPR